MARKQEERKARLADSAPELGRADVGSSASVAPSPEEAQEVDRQHAGAARGVRLVCSLPNAGSVISGVRFAHVDIDGKTLHVSERVSDTLAKRMLGISGYRTFEGDHEAEIDAAIKWSIEREAQERRGPSGSATEAQLRAELAEHQRANKAMAAELDRLRQELDGLRPETKQPRAKLSEAEAAAKTAAA